jgi:hypothetical protein
VRCLTQKLFEIETVRGQAPLGRQELLNPLAADLKNLRVDEGSLGPER